MNVMKFSAIILLASLFTAGTQAMLMEVGKKCEEGEKKCLAEGKSKSECGQEKENCYANVYRMK